MIKPALFTSRDVLDWTHYDGNREAFRSCHLDGPAHHHRGHRSSQSRLLCSSVSPVGNVLEF